MGIMADNKLNMCMTHAAIEEQPILLDEGKMAGVKGFWTWRMGGETDEFWVELAKKGLKWAPNHGEHVDGRGEVFNRTWKRMMKIGVENLLGGSSLNIWPSYRHPVEGLKEELKNALIKAGKERLSKEIDKQIDEQLDKAPDEVKDVIKDSKGLLDGLGGLLKEKDDK